LEDFDYKIEHRPDKGMMHVDALSRNPLPTCLVVQENDILLTARIKRAQNEDDDVKKIRKLICQGKAANFIERGGLLLRELNGAHLVVVPKRLQGQVIRKMHEQGHFSRLKI